jgi:hypothetical protein
VVFELNPITSHAPLAKAYRVMRNSLSPFH